MGIHVWAFVAVAALVIVTPGPDTAIVTKNALLHGRSAALGTVAGVSSGLVIWTMAAALGLAAVVRESAVAFTVLKIAGALYLVWLGIQALRSARRRVVHEAGAAGVRGRRADVLAGTRQGMLSNLGNPKIAVFFTSLLPQFVSASHAVLIPFLALGGLFVLMTFLWLSFYAVLASRISDVLGRPSVRAWLDRVTGAVLIGLGIRLALEHR